MLFLRYLACAFVLSSASATVFAAGTVCRTESASTVAVRNTWLASVAIELAPATTQLGGASGVLVQSFDEAFSADNVLTRIRFDGCLQALKAAAESPAAATDPAAYKPQTAFDNTPWRFNMTQDGKRMTADEFDAWMKARGVRIVKPKDASATPVQPDK